MAHPGLHKNDKTQKLVSRDVQVCHVCFQNFSSTRAGDRHRKGKYSPVNNRRCYPAEEVGLIPKVNQFGSVIYGLPKKA